MSIDGKSEIGRDTRRHHPSGDRKGGDNCLVAADSPGTGKPAALFVVSLETGDKKQLTYPQFPAIGDTNPAVSPDEQGASLPAVDKR
jgi:hypothetical protein